MQNAHVLHARITGVNPENRNKFYAHGPGGRECIIGKKEGDYGYFRFVKRVFQGERSAFMNANASPTPFARVEILTDGENFLKASLVVPDDYLKIHRDGTVYVIDTRHGNPLLDRSEGSASDEKYLEFAGRAVVINPLLAYPLVCMSKDSIKVYRTREDLVWTRFNGNDISALLDALEGRNMFLKDDEASRDGRDVIAKAHLIINTTGATLDNVFRFLASCGTRIERWGIEDSTGIPKRYLGAEYVLDRRINEPL
jgi:hypothetical protein